MKKKVLILFYLCAQVKLWVPHVSWEQFLTRPLEMNSMSVYFLLMFKLFTKVTWYFTYTSVWKSVNCSLRSLGKLPTPLPTASSKIFSQATWQCLPLRPWPMSVMYDWVEFFLPIHTRKATWVWLYWSYSTSFTVCDN